MPYLAQKLKTKKTTEVKLQNLKKDNFIETRNIRKRLSKSNLEKCNERN